MNRAGWKMWSAIDKYDCAVKNLLRRDAVSDINEPRVGLNCQRCRLHLCNVWTVGSKVGGKCDDGLQHDRVLRHDRGPDIPVRAKKILRAGQECPAHDQYLLVFHLANQLEANPLDVGRVRVRIAFLGLTDESSNGLLLAVSYVGHDTRIIIEQLLAE